MQNNSPYIFPLGEVQIKEALRHFRKFVEIVQPNNAHFEKYSSHTQLFLLKYKINIRFT